MRAIPPSQQPPVQLSIDEGAVVIGLLDLLADAALPRTPEVLELAGRTRHRMSTAVADAIAAEAEPHHDDPAGTLRDQFFDLQVAFRALSQRFEENLRTFRELRGVAGRVRALVGESGPVIVEADDQQLATLRRDLERVAA